MKARKVEFDSGSVCVWETSASEQLAEHQKWCGADMTGIFISPLGRLAAPFFIIFHLGLPPFAPLFIIRSSAASPFFFFFFLVEWLSSSERGPRGQNATKMAASEMKSKSLFFFISTPRMHSKVLQLREHRVWMEKLLEIIFREFSGFLF